MAFSSKGKMYRLLVDNVPAGTNASKGVSITSLINTEPNEKIIAITSLFRKTNAEYVVFVTKNGLIKKTKLEEYSSIKKSTGIAAIKLKEGDSLANVTFLKDEDMIVVTEQGFSIHFSTAEISPIGRVTAGVRAIKLMDRDRIVVGLPIHKDTDEIALFLSNGVGKKVPLSEYPLQARGGKGVITYKASSTNRVVGAAMVDEKDNLLLIGNPNSICIPAKEVPSLTRVGLGNIMIKNSHILSVVKL